MSDDAIDAEVAGGCCCDTDGNDPSGMPLGLLLLVGTVLFGVRRRPGIR